MHQPDKKDNMIYWITYTLLFAAMIPAVLSILIASGKSLVWNSDGLRQHYIALVYLGRWGREVLENIFLHHTFEIPLWDFSIGYGSDIMTSLHYYVFGDPLNLISIAVPSRYTEHLYGILILFRMYLSGISFSIYCRKRNLSRQASLAGTFCYVFCGYTMFSAARHPFFLIPMIYFPLLLVGAERIFEGKKSPLFSIMVFLSAISNFYCFYMIVFAVCFYVFVRFFTLRHERPFKDFLSVIGRFFCHACIGVLMSAIIFFPILIQFSGTSRMNASQIYGSLYSLRYYKKFMSSFLNSFYVGEWTVLGFTAPSALAIIVLFGKRKQHTALKISFLTLTAMLWIPFFGKILNGFSYVSNRWCWIYASLISYITAVVWKDLTELKPVSKLIVTTGSLAYLVCLATLGAKRECILFGGLLLILAVFKALSGILKKDVFFRLIPLTLFCIILLHSISNWRQLFFASHKNNVSTYTDFGKAYQKTSSTSPFAVNKFSESEKNFYRIETDNFEVANSPLLADHSSVLYYWSLENGCISNYLMDMSIAKFRVFNFKDLDHRTFLDALADVKYFVQNKTDYLPYGYEYLDTVPLGPNEFRVYKNKYALPLGYTYRSRIPYESYQNMDPISRQEALLQGIVLDKEPDGSFDKTPTANPSFTSKSIDYNLECKKNVTQQPDGSFLAAKKGAAVELSFEGMEKCETYVWIRGANINSDAAKEFTVRFISDESRNVLRFNTQNHKLYSGQKDFIVNLGYHEKPLTSIKIKFPYKGVYSFDDIKIICQPMENYKRQVEALQTYKMENEEIGVNTVKGSVSVPDERILCLSIPYTKGWNATVDGKKETLLKANIMYMALPLSKGTHTIELTYQTPGLSAGIGMSIGGFLLFIFTFRRKKDKKRKTA